MASLPVLEIRKSLQQAESEILNLQNLTRELPGIQKNIAPILSFLDILKFHLGDLPNEK